MPMLLDTATDRLAFQLSTELRLALADRASMRNSGAVVDLGKINGMRSGVVKENIYGLDGVDSFEVMPAEDSEVNATPVSIDQPSISVARAAMRRDPSDFYVLTGQSGARLDVSRLAQSMAPEYEQYWMQLLADEIDGFSGNVTSTGGSFTVDDQMDGIFALELRGVEGPFYELLHNRQTTHFKGSLRGETGPLMWIPATAEMLKIKGQGYQGNFLDVDIWRSNKVNSSGGNRHGAIWGAGALGYRTGTPEPDPSVIVFSKNDAIMVALMRNEARAITAIIGHAYTGMGILQDDLGEQLISPA